MIFFKEPRFLLFLLTLILKAAVLKNILSLDVSMETQENSAFMANDCLPRLYVLLDHYGPSVIPETSQTCFSKTLSYQI